MVWQFLLSVAAVLAALSGVAWWFALRIGRRVPATADSGPIEVGEAIEYARRAIAQPGPQHADLARL